MIIRRATVDDRPEILAMGLEFHGEQIAPFGFHCDAEGMAALIDATLEDPNRAIFVASDGPGRLAGMIVGAIVPSLFDGKQLIAQEIAWYVSPEARGGLAAFRLIRAYENWARERGAIGITVAHMAEPGSLRISQLYDRMNYRPLEVQYTKEV